MVGLVCGRQSFVGLSLSAVPRCLVCLELVVMLVVECLLLVGFRFPSSSSSSSRLHFSKSITHSFLQLAVRDKRSRKRVCTNTLNDTPTLKSIQTNECVDDCVDGYYGLQITCTRTALNADFRFKTRKKRSSTQIRGACEVEEQLSKTGDCSWST